MSAKEQAKATQLKSALSAFAARNKLKAHKRGTVWYPGEVDVLKLSTNKYLVVQESVSNTELMYYGQSCTPGRLHLAGTTPLNHEQVIRWLNSH